MPTTPRPRHSSRNNSQKWKRARAQVLATSTTCHLCGGPGADAVDHLTPVSQAPELEYDPTNLAPAHHNVPPYCNRIKGTKTYAPGILRRSGSLTPPTPGG